MKVIKIKIPDERTSSFLRDTVSYSEAVEENNDGILRPLREKLRRALETGSLPLEPMFQDKQMDIFCKT